MTAGISKKITTVFFSIIISLLAVEILLRIFGTEPWKNILTNDSVSGKQIYSPDKVLGWKAKEGAYLILPSNPSDKKFKINIKENSNRETGINEENTNGEIFVVGGSFSLGWGIDDEDTFSYKLQKKINNFKIYNYAQAGYGTVQSLLFLEKQIPKMKAPKFTVYGFIEHHEYRNVARSQWLRTLAKYSKRGTVRTPYGLIDERNKLIIHPPIGYTNLSFKEFSSLITVFEKAYMKNMNTKVFPRDSKRKKQQKMVTKKAILQMKEISNKFGSEFILVILDWSNNLTIDNYKIFFKKNKIKYVNCKIPLVGEMVLKDDYHPSAKAHSYYSECLINYIKKERLIF